MICGLCGLRIGKDERFVLVGFYPSLSKRVGFRFRYWVGLDIFGEIFHEDCYLKSMGRDEPRTKQSVKP